MKYKIGVFGSAEDEKKALKKAEELGKELSKKDVIIVTGACDGIPYKVASTAAKLGTEIWGFAPTTSIKEEEKIAKRQDRKIYRKLFYISKDYSFKNDIQVCRKYRNVTSTANCDAGIIISGRWGTMNEFTNLYDMGKVIGILTGSGGIADELAKLMKKIVKKSKAEIVFDSNPKRLVVKLIGHLKKSPLIFELQNCRE